MIFLTKNVLSPQPSSKVSFYERCCLITQRIPKSNYQHESQFWNWTINSIFTRHQTFRTKLPPFKTKIIIFWYIIYFILFSICYFRLVTYQSKYGYGFHQPFTVAFLFLNFYEMLFYIPESYCVDRKNNEKNSTVSVLIS